MYQIRTDLALETQEKMQEDHVELKGVRFLEEKLSPNLTVSTVVIETENGAKTMGKPKGTYITIEAADMDEEDEDYHREVSEQLARVIRQLVRLQKESLSVLIAGLGNREVTPDALGPYVADHLNITRHVIREYGRYALHDQRMRLVSAIVPGVMGQTGMETVEIVKGIVKETKPDLVIAIDALAARNTKRLNRTIQVADTGIQPGSGVGNHRSAICQETLGIPVIAIGVPTVVDAATIVNDSMENLIQALETSEALRGVGLVLQGYNAAEKYELVKELISPHLNGMFVTPKDIDDTVRRISRIVCDAINQLCVCVE